jgi:regulator of sigma E protease
VTGRRPPCGAEPLPAARVGGDAPVRRAGGWASAGRRDRGGRRRRDLDLRAAARTGRRVGGGELLLTVWRAGETLELPLAPKRRDLPREDGAFETRWLIGVNGGLYFSPETATPGVLEALGHGVEQTRFVITSSLSGLYHMAVGAISTCNLSGPIGIAETSGVAASQGWISFIWFIAVLSAAVGLLNLFPVPVLDGGHLVFHAWEALTGRPPADAVLRVMMGIGIGLIGLLMVFALSNDIFCP